MATDPEDARDPPRPPASPALSLRARLLPAVLRRALKPLIAGEASLTTQRRAMLWWTRFGRMPRGVEVVPRRLGGCPAERIQTAGAGEEASDVVLMLHGGGYCWGGLPTHREFAARLAIAAQRPVYLLDYRLAPEHPYPAAIEDAAAAIGELREIPGIRSLAVVGDSAGGGLALATMLRLRDRGLPLPDRAAFVSPWLDLTQSGDSIRGLRGTDPVISPSALEACAALYAGAEDRRSPELSPLFGDLQGMPPLFIQVASKEVLLDDSLRLAARCQAAGVPAELEVSAGLWHVWHLFASAVPEGRMAIERLAGWLQLRISSGCGDSPPNRTLQ